MCVGYLRSRHFVQVYLKSGCPIPSTSVEWMEHHEKEAESWPNHFLERMTEFTHLMDLERKANREKSKNESVLDLSGDNFFGSF